MFDLSSLRMANHPALWRWNWGSRASSTALRLIGRVFAEQQTAPNYGYLFEVSADRKRIVRCAHISAIGGDSGNPDGEAERLEKDARQAVEEFLGCERKGK
jgi:hypothetical protein